ncbi:uncharacterized protein BDCG_04785 [Blastomyces dermatitidis ER-3]|uniref:Uncharacterized protein n=1 Tax=Ajellomyces dermatitidis (strain ER-3 / ATCC MYA-2586) TaxID=559297 RepID=A0ABP2F330_AJEDR|nr:uncharacterized protein BDCG_04785 [Blastomyces dermatitidis ER-3]EEQ89665.2 hypothetical protein BDCG_04785 [Blastomyces dermatitidis ER-3]
MSHILFKNHDMPLENAHMRIIICTDTSFASWLTKVTGFVTISGYIEVNGQLCVQEIIKSVDAIFDRCQKESPYSKTPIGSGDSDGERFNIRSSLRRKGPKASGTAHQRYFILIPDNDG